MINARSAAKTANVSDDRREAIRSLYMESLQLVERLQPPSARGIKDSSTERRSASTHPGAAPSQHRILLTPASCARAATIWARTVHNRRSSSTCSSTPGPRARQPLGAGELTEKGQECRGGRQARQRHIGSTRAVGGITRTSSSREPRAPAPGPFLERHHRLCACRPFRTRPHVGGCGPALCRKGTAHAFPGRSGRRRCRNATLPPYSDESENACLGPMLEQGAAGKPSCPAGSRSRGNVPCAVAFPHGAM